MGDFEDLIDGTLSEAAQVKQFSAIIAEIDRETKENNEHIVGHPVPSKMTPGTITSIAEIVTLTFAVSEDILNYIAQLLSMHAPVGSGLDRHPGQFLASIKLYADGVLVEDVTKPPQAREYIFASVLPYAAKIESGESSQAPHGVFEVTANEAQKRFTNSTIDYIDHVDSLGEYPAIRVIL